MSAALVCNMFLQLANCIEKFCLKKNSVVNVEKWNGGFHFSTPVETRNIVSNL